MEANNMKAMREALTETQSVIEKCMDILNKIPDKCGYGGLLDDVADELCSLREEYVKVALAAPLRNCDVGTTEEQEVRFKSFCESHWDLNKPDSECAGCPLDERVGIECEFAWMQMPYEKGETYGSK